MLDNLTSEGACSSPHIGLTATEQKGTILSVLNAFNTDNIAFRSQGYYTRSNLPDRKHDRSRTGCTVSARVRRICLRARQPSWL